MPLAPGTRIGAYEIVAPLGAGGMGEVYRARDSRLGREVAIKVLPAGLGDHPERLARLEREARAVAALNHPGIVTLHSLEDADGVRFLTMELVEGDSLDRQLAASGLPIERVLEIGIALTEAVSAAHGKGVVHRDLKPSNVMVTTDGRVKVLDFGLAKLASPEPPTEMSQANTMAAPLSAVGQVLGTVPYMAPEQLRGESSDARTDVFALGIVLYEMACGRRPFLGVTIADVSSAILRDAPQPLLAVHAELPEEFERIVGRCLQKSPRERYQTALDVTNDLKALQRGLHRGPFGPSPALPAVGHAKARSARRWWIAALVPVLIVAGWFVYQRLSARGPVAPATSGARSVAVLEFANLSGDPALDWMKRGVADLLSTALVQSSALDVFDASRLGDLAGSKAASTPALAPTNAFLAGHGIRRAISGSILRSGAALRIEGRILDTSNGRLVRSFAVEGVADSGLFHLVGRLIPDLQVALEVNLTGDHEAEGWLREITTTSADAYRLYIRGHEALLASRWNEAAAAFTQALELDSTFVAARTEQVGAVWNLGNEADLALYRAAMGRLRARADHRGQMRIDLMQGVIGRDPPGLIRAASALAQLYPENPFYAYMLGRGYFTDRQYQRCLDTLQPLMANRYGWSWTYVLSAQSAAALGDTARAIRAFELGLDVTNKDPELAYAYVRFLRSRGPSAVILGILEGALRSPTLAETPAGEGGLRLELAKELFARGDSLGARRELAHAGRLLPAMDEAWNEADSLMQMHGLKARQSKSLRP